MRPVIQMTVKRTCKSTENCVNNEIGILLGNEEACDTTVGHGAVNLGFCTFLQTSLCAFVGDFGGAGVVGVCTGSLVFLLFFLLFARTFFVCGLS